MDYLLLNGYGIHGAGLVFIRSVYFYFINCIVAFRDIAGNILEHSQVKFNKGGLTNNRHVVQTNFFMFARIAIIFNEEIKSKYGDIY